MRHTPSVSGANLPRLPADATDEDDAQADAASLAEFEAGGGVPHATVAEWLRTWGTPDRRSFWDWYKSRNG
jgi:hypothetical protein